MIGVGVATAAPGSGGVITSCYQKSTGALRVIDTDAGEQCKKTETPLVWSTGTAALTDGSVVGGSGGVVADGTLSKEDLGTNSVESDELADGSVGSGELAGDAVTSGKILNGEVGTSDLAGDAVTSAKIDDGTIVRGDLADGAVTSEKVTANASTGNMSGTILATPGPTTQPVSSVFLQTEAADQSVLIVGQAQLTCVCAGLGDSVDVTWQVFEGTRAVSQEYRSVLSPAMRTTLASVSALDFNSGPASGRSYELRVTAEGASATSVTSSANSLTAVDLGH